jgi:prepilin-type N-terminal cleavage/methylation domain-containing protein
MTKATCFSRRGFTLLELLVVVAIICLLAAILFPVFARIRENARRASCLSNLKQISLGVLQYRQDNDDKIVMVNGGTTGKWLDVYLPYIQDQRVFLCPSAYPQRTAPKLSAYDTDYNSNRIVYGGVGVGTSWPIFAVCDESATMFIMDGYGNSTWSDCYYSYGYVGADGSN